MSREQGPRMEGMRPSASAAGHRHSQTQVTRLNVMEAAA